jgi:5'-3' exoribonuclease 2
MGVPAFFKWLSSKYPKIIVDCIESDDPLQPNPNGVEYDNLYLDMNGIIHPACHPEDRQPPETEDDMCVAVFAYLQRVFSAVRPRKLCFIAIDGVAPRAKMNQQRSRRFKSAKEAEEKEEEESLLRAQWTASGRVPPVPATTQAFDSNVITPGTQFMHRLGSLLKAFVHEKASSDPQWQGLHVIFSDSSVPGEGEHKVMEFIRSQRGAAGYDPNTRHVIHGLDADLILLALATHEPHFSILREYTGPAAAKPAATPSGRGGAAKSGEVPFQLLQISTLREYLDLEFGSSDFQPVGYSLERVIDDFVFLCCFVGNDFLPHLPSLAIRDGALDTLCALYVSHFQIVGGWITDGGEVDLERVRRFTAELARIEPQLLHEHASSEERYVQGQRRREQEKGTRACERKHNQMRTRLAAAFGDTAVLGRDADVFGIFEAVKSFSLLGPDAPSEALPAGLTPYQRAMAHNYCDELGVSNASKGAEPNRRLWMSKLEEGSTADEEAFKKELAARCKDRSQLPEETDAIQLGRPGYRQRFYSAKFYSANLRSEADVDDLARDLASSFAKGLCFVMRYYYQGCPSWCCDQRLELSTTYSITT